LAPAAPPESEGWQRGEDAERNQSGFLGQESKGDRFYLEMAVALNRPAVHRRG